MESSRRSQIEVFLKKIGVECLRLEPFDFALTHPSYFAKKRQFASRKISYEKLEFLGDSVINLCVVSYLYQSLPHLNEGELSCLRASLVSKQFLSKMAREWGMGEMILLSPFEQKRKIEENASVLENSFECFLGTCYLEIGFENTRDLIAKNLEKEISKNLAFHIKKSDKTMLQEWFQKNKQTPEYRLEQVEGAPHERIYNVGVYKDDTKIAEGRGSSVKMAESDGAKNALLLLSEKNE